MDEVLLTKVMSKRQYGFSLVELMVAITIGLFILAGMVTLFAANSASMQELEKSSRQVESGRYAVEMLRDEVQLAAFYGDYMPASSTVWTIPDPCTTALGEMGFSGSMSPANVPTGIFGYESAQSLTTNCATVLANRKSGTDVFVVHRAGTESMAAASVVDGPFNLQVSNCSDFPLEAPFVLAKTKASFSLHDVKPAGNPASCLNGTLSPVRPYVTRIFFVADCNSCAGSGDGIPTLKMAELTSTGFQLRSVAEGIENLQIEYGIDTAGNDGVADLYVKADAAELNDTNTSGSPPVTTITPGANKWANVVSVRFFVLARNTESTPGYQDTKKYILDSAGLPATAVSFSDGVKRHVFSLTARANNVAGRRQI